jgi:hypothetical protein
MYTSAVAGSVLATYPIYSGADQVRRVGGYRLPGAVNNISTMLAVGIAIAIVGIVYKENWKKSIGEILSLPPLILGLILSGSRAAMIGLAISILILVFNKGKKTQLSMIALGILATFSFFILNSIYNLIGLNRFTPQELAGAVNTRLTLYQTAIQQSGLDPIDLLFGGGMYRYAKISNEIGNTVLITYPHNYVISTMVHIGLPAAVLFGLILILNYKYLFYYFSVEETDIEYLISATFLSLIIISMYSFTSGRITRTFPLWIFLAISTFLIDDLR